MRRTLVGVLLAATACSGGDVAATPTGAATAPRSPAPSAAPSGPVRPLIGEPSEVVAKVAVGGQPCGVVAAAGAVWVTDAQSATLVRIDAASNAVVTSTPVDATPCELTFGYGALWVATQSGVLDRVDPATGRVVARIPVGETSYEPLVAFGSVWVTNRNSGTVSRVDPRTNRVVATIDVPGTNPGGIVAVGDRLWIGNDTSGSTDVVRMDPRTGAIETFSAGARPAFVAAAAGAVFTADEGGHTVSRLDATTGAILGTALAGVRPVNLVALPVARPEIWVPDDQGGLLTRIDATTGEVIERMLGGRGPAVMAAHGSDVWVTNFEDGTAWRIRPGLRP